MSDSRVNRTRKQARAVKLAAQQLAAGQVAR
jgi:hypothetical protein